MPEDIKQEVVLKTQKCLGKYVKKPPLSDKLLKKPPFRFLHDVIKAVITETGFLHGLFSAEELNAENVKDRDAKVAFLAKLIDAVKTITKVDLAVRPSKIVAGLEPTETNLLLQAIAKAIDKKLDSAEYVKQKQTGGINVEKNKKSKRTSDKTKKVSPKAIESNIKQQSPKTNESPKATEKTKIKKSSRESKAKEEPENNRRKSKENHTKKISEPKIEKGEPISEPSNDKIALNVETEETSSSLHESKIQNGVTEYSPPVEESTKTPTIEKQDPENESKKRYSSAARPKSARPKSGENKQESEQRQHKEQVEENREPVLMSSRPKSSLRPASVRPSSARPGAPRLRPDSGFPMKEIVPMGKINVIVENFDKDADEEETIVIQSTPPVPEQENESLVDVPDNNKGHLVEQILEQINDSDENKSNSNVDENDWRKDLYHGNDTATETSNLRNIIQSLTKTANPLGKLLNYLHEDIETMNAELESWTLTKRQLTEEIVKEKRISMELNKPLIAQLSHLTEEIKKMEQQIATTRHTVLQNDQKIKLLVR